MNYYWHTKPRLKKRGDWWVAIAVGFAVESHAATPYEAWKLHRWGLEGWRPS